MSFWTQTLEMARTDLRVERRVGETVRIVAPFAVMALLLIPMALGPELSIISRIGFPVFWALGLLFGMQIALRQVEVDTPERRDLYALLGVDPAARFVGRAISGSILTVSFLTIMGLAMLVFYDPVVPDGAVAPILVAVILAATGLTQLGTLAGQVTLGLRARTSLAGLIVAPLSLPLLIGASQILESVSRGAGILPWLLLMVATNLALTIAGVALAPYLEENGL